MIKKYAPYVWMNGRIIARSKAKISLFAPTVLYGYGAFEGMKIYKCFDGRFAIFRLHAHINRLFESVSALGLILPMAISDIEQAAINIAKKNISVGENYDYIRPLVFLDEEELSTHENPVRLAFLMWEWEPYFGTDASRGGISVAISKWRRIGSVMPFQAKITGNYVNAQLAKKEAKKSGFQDAIILNSSGSIVEGSASNVCFVADGELIIPDFSLPLLKGITLNSVLKLGARKLNLPFHEFFAGEQLFYAVDEAFLTNTSGEIAPIKDVEGNPVGKSCPGPVTKKLQDLFSKAVRGEISEYRHWLTYID